MRKFISYINSNILSEKAIIILTVAALILLLPFINKAVHIDDPLFIWAAKHIRAHPLDPYGFNVNWYGVEMPMYEITKNPPLTSYYLALISLFIGWSEVAMHLAMIIPALAVIWGTYRLSAKLAPSPLIAALSTLLTPVFLLSATTIMSDIIMSALWVWAVVLWLEGMDKEKQYLLLLSGIIIAAAIFAKYYAVSLVPLLSIYSIMRKGYDIRKISSWSWVPYLLIPLLLLLSYDLYTGHLYGKGLFSDAGAYAGFRNTFASGKFLPLALTGLSFSGGCLLPMLFFFPFFKQRKKALLQLLATAVLTALLVFLLPAAITRIFPDNNEMSRLLLPQFTIMLLAGLTLLTITAMDFLTYRNASSGLLCAWIFGTFFFASMMNWTINGRSILPMAPAIGTILARRISLSKIKASLIIWPVLAAAALSLAVCYADYTLAGTARAAAKSVISEAKSSGRNINYQGHWGFQYYMDLGGAEALDFSHPLVETDSLLIIPTNNTNVRKISAAEFTLYGVKDFKSCSWLTTMHNACGAGFYSSIWGPLPYAIIASPPECYYMVRKTASYHKMEE